MKPSKKIAKYQLSPRVESEVRVTRPKLGYKADYCGSRTAAIHMFCLVCMGGSRSDVVACKSYSCPLWQFRPGREKGVKPPGLPSDTQYQEMINENISDKQRAAGKRLKGQNE